MKLYFPPFKLEYKKKRFFLNGRLIRPKIRRLRDLKLVLLEKEILNLKNQNEALYLIFRNIMRKEDREIFLKCNIRFDITIIFNKFLGIEFNKTFGHLHPVAEKNLTYPEVYEVLHGKALFILQHFKKDKKIDKVLIIFGKEKDKILIPPNYGHTTINIGNSDLIIANLVSSRFDSLYEEYRKREGAAIYIVKKNALKDNKKCLKESLLIEFQSKKTNRLNFRILKNKNYNEKFEIEFFRPEELFRFPKENLYLSFIENPKFYNFLNKPSSLEVKI